MYLSVYLLSIGNINYIFKMKKKNNKQFKVEHPLLIDLELLTDLLGHF